jgi:hypothetical protein
VNYSGDVTLKKTKRKKKRSSKGFIHLPCDSLGTFLDRLWQKPGFIFCIFIFIHIFYYLFFIEQILIINHIFLFLFLMSLSIITYSLISKNGVHKILLDWIKGLSLPLWNKLSLVENKFKLTFSFSECFYLEINK